MESSSLPLANASDQVNGVEEQDPLEEFSRQLEDIISTYGSASSLMEDQISMLEKEEEKLEVEAHPTDVVAGVEVGKEATVELLKGLGKDASLLLENLNKLSSPEEKLETVLRKYAELLLDRRQEQGQLSVLQHRQGLLVKQKDQLQLQLSHALLARSKLESLCRELQAHHRTLKEDMLQRCQEEEAKHTEITRHFQSTLVDIQAQIEYQSNRNNNLCKENSELADKLQAIIQQYEQREESLEKMFKQRDLQQKLSDARLEEANLRLKEVETKHLQEKEYLLKEAIEKTKACFTMKEQELELKKQLLTQAAEWKLQARELKEQHTVMQAQLVLYSEKFDEFQATLSKSNEVYATFKQEMDKMNKKMKKVEMESNIWKTRFENCNKTLTDMIEERSEKGKELELFTVKISKLETLCRALQDERKVLYNKIKDIRLQGFAAVVPVKEQFGEDISELAQPGESEAHNPALTVEMEKLWKEQERLQKFAASLMASTTADLEDSGNEDASEPAPEVPIPSNAPAGKLESILEEPGCLEERKRQIITEKPCEPLPAIPEPVKTEAVQLKAEQEHIKQELHEEKAKAESPAEEATKEDVAKVEPVEQNTAKQKPSMQNLAQQKEVKPKTLGTDTVQPKPPNTEVTIVEASSLQEPQVETANNALNSAGPPREELIKDGINPAESSKATPARTLPSTSLVRETEPIKTEASTSEHVQAEPKLDPQTEAAQPQASSSQETKPKTSKAQPKKVAPSKKKGAAKSAKKS